MDEANKEISENSILDFHLAHRTSSEFQFEPNKDTPKLIWKYLSSSNLLYKIQDLEITDIEKTELLKKPAAKRAFEFFRCKRCFFKCK